MRRFLAQRPLERKVRGRGQQMLKLMIFAALLSYERPCTADAHAEEPGHDADRPMRAPSGYG